MAEKRSARARTNEKERSIVGINLHESRTRNIAAEIHRRGYEVKEFRIAKASDLRNLGALCCALSRAEFALMGPSIPWGVVPSYLARVLRKPLVLDCPMDITEWPFAEAPNAKRSARLLIRSASRVLTIETRGYFRERFNLRRDALVFVESCPDEEALQEAEKRGAPLEIPAGTFVVCCSGGALHHRLERFVPIFEELAPMVPEAVLLVIADQAQPLARAARALASRPGFDKRVLVSPIIKPVADFFATLRRVNLWVATLGNDTLQGDREFRMELLEAARLGIPVAAAKTGALAHHGLMHGEQIIYLDSSSTEAAAATLASYVGRPTELREIGLRLRALVLKRFAISDAVDIVLRALPGETERTDSRGS